MAENRDAKRPAHRAYSVIKRGKFFNVELTPLADGRVQISMTATTVDDQVPRLLTQKIIRDTAATIDDALAVIKASLTCPA